MPQKSQINEYSVNYNFTPTVDVIIAADPTFQDDEVRYFVNYQVILRK